MPTAKRRPRHFCPSSPLHRSHVLPHTRAVTASPPYVSASASASASLPLPPLIPTSPDQSCGFAALVGPSNSGKSTLLNRLLGQKLAIVTPKVQTTRCRIAGIATYGLTQVVYLDTPGIFSASNRLARAMVKSAWASAGHGDTVAVVLDAAAMFHNARRMGVRKLLVPDDAADVMKRVAERRKRGHPAEIKVCANKIDAVPEEEREFVKERMLTVMEKLGLNEVGAELHLMSARDGEGVEELATWVKERMPKGPWLYPEDDLTDMPARLLAAEVSREKAFMVLKQELPYEIAIETTSYKEQEDGSIRITQDVLVGRNSQKIIVTGKGGAVVKAIGMKARHELAEVLGTTVHLMLTVKVRGKWKEDKRQYDQWGLDYNA